MIKYLYITTLAVFTLFLISSCGSKKKEENKEEEFYLSYNETMQGGTIQMEKLYIADSVIHNGQRYDYEITRISDSLLPKVVDAESGVNYMDNSVTICVKKDGAVLYQKKYTKTDFNQFLDEGFKKNGMLEGFVFNKADDKGLQFATSISYPQSDMYIPIVLTISYNGSVSMEKDEFIDEGMEE